LVYANFEKPPGVGARPAFPMNLTRGLILRKR